MRMIRLSDGVEGDVMHVHTLLMADPAPEPFAALIASGAIERSADNVRVVRDGAVESAGLGDYVGVFGGEAFTLSERQFVRGFDPV